MTAVGEWLEDACRGEARVLNAQFDLLRWGASQWEPQPCPVDPSCLTRIDGELYGDDPLLRP